MTIRFESRGDQMKLKKLTPNLVVRNVEASLNFYRAVLGFQPGFTVPDAPPYVFGSVISDSVEIFFNDHKAVAEEYPALGAKPIGGSLTLFIEVEGIEDFFKKVLQHGAKITMPMKDPFHELYTPESSFCTITFFAAHTALRP